MAVLIAVSTLIVAASPLSAAPIFATYFATYSGSNAGSLNDVGFSMTGLSAATCGVDIQNLSMSDADWSGVGIQQGRIFNGNTTTTFDVTFKAPASGLQVYLYHFRAAVSGGDGYDFHDFNGGIGNTFTITGGIGSPITQSETTLDTSSAHCASGVIAFAAPVSTLTVTTTGGPATGGDQGLAFAAVPEPGGAGLVTVVCAGLFAGLAARRSRRC